MKLEFYYDSTEENAWSETESILDILEQLEEQDTNINPKKIDTSEITENERHEIYSRVVEASSSRRYKVKPIFTDKDRSEVFFGKQQPALLIYRDKVPSEIYAETQGKPSEMKKQNKKQLPSDVYPHETPGGGRVETMDYLEKLVKAMYYVGALKAPPG